MRGSEASRMRPSLSSFRRAVTSVLPMPWASRCGAPSKPWTGGGDGACCGVGRLSPAAILGRSAGAARCQGPGQLLVRERLRDGPTSGARCRGLGPAAVLDRRRGVLRCRPPVARGDLGSVGGRGEFIAFGAGNGVRCWRGEAHCGRRRCPPQRFGLRHWFGCGRRGNAGVSAVRRRGLFRHRAGGGLGPAAVLDRRRGVLRCRQPVPAAACASKICAAVHFFLRLWHKMDARAS